MGVETLALTSLAATGASTLFGMQGASQSASAARSEALYRAAIANRNAEYAKKSAAIASEAGDIRAQNQSLQTAAQIGQIKSGQAASGIDVNTGSAVDVRESAAELGRLDALTLRYNAQKEAYNALTQSQSYEMQGGLDQMAARNASRAGDIKEASTLLSGATSFADKWMGFSRSGVKF